MVVSHSRKLTPGTVVGGRYEVCQRLGVGSIGVVYLCRHRELSGLPVALKVLHDNYVRDEGRVARFRQNIVSCYQVSHPNVVRIFEYFRDRDMVAFTVEYVPEGSLVERLSLRELLPLSVVFAVLRQVCSGLRAIHDVGLIHRDLKPANVLFGSDGQVKLADYAIGFAGGIKLSELDGVVGTFDYVSPEYLQSAQVDARSDIYALGGIAYEMITGRCPFFADSVIESLTARLESDPLAPTELRPGCPLELSEAVLKMLSRNPEDRFQTSQEVEELFSDFQREAVHWEQELESGKSSDMSVVLSEEIIPEKDSGLGVAAPSDEPPAPETHAFLSSQKLKSSVLIEDDDNPFVVDRIEERPVVQPLISPGSNVSVSNQKVTADRLSSLLEPEASNSLFLLQVGAIILLSIGIVLLLLLYYVE